MRIYANYSLKDSLQVIGHFSFGNLKAFIRKNGGQIEHLRVLLIVHGGGNRSGHRFFQCLLSLLDRKLQQFPSGVQIVQVLQVHVRQRQITGLDEIGERVHLFDVVLERIDSFSEALQRVGRLVGWC